MISLLARGLGPWGYCGFFCMEHKVNTMEETEVYVKWGKGPFAPLKKSLALSPLKWTPVIKEALFICTNDPLCYTCCNQIGHRSARSTVLYWGSVYTQMELPQITTDLKDNIGPTVYWHQSTLNANHRQWEALEPQTLLQSSNNPTSCRLYIPWLWYFPRRIG